MAEWTAHALPPSNRIIWRLLSFDLFLEHQEKSLPSASKCHKCLLRMTESSHRGNNGKREKSSNSRRAEVRRDLEARCSLLAWQHCPTNQLALRWSRYTSKKASEVSISFHREAFEIEIWQVAREAKEIGGFCILCIIKYATLPWHASFSPPQKNGARDRQCALRRDRKIDGHAVGKADVELLKGGDHRYFPCNRDIIWLGF